MDASLTKKPVSAEALLDELQAMLSRQATQDELMAWARSQEQLVQSQQPLAHARDDSGRVTGHAITALPPMAAKVPVTAAEAPAVMKRSQRPHASTDVSPQGRGTRQPQSPTTLSAGLTPASAGHARAVPSNSPSTNTISTNTLPPILETGTARRADVEGFLGSVFSRSGPAEVGKKHTTPPHRSPLTTEVTNLPVPPGGSASASTARAFTRRGLLPTPLTPSSSVTRGPQGGSSNPLLDEMVGTPAREGSTNDAPPRVTPLSDVKTTTVTPLPPHTQHARPSRELGGLPQVLHVSDIAAQMGGSSLHSAGDSLSTGGSSALIDHMRAGVSTDEDSFPGSGGFRPARSVLNVSAYMDAAENPLVNGAIPLFGSDDGPQFARATFQRRLPVYVPIEETKAALEALNVPVMEEVLNAAHEVDVVKLCLDHGLRNLFVHTSLNVLLRYGFVKRLGLNTQKLQAFLTSASTFFREGNPFHHPFHASDVIIAAHQWLAQPTAAPHLSDMEIFAFLFAAIVMRVGHCGADNDFLAQVHHPFATIFGYSAPQQGATMALVLALLDQPANHFLPALTLRSTLMPLTRSGDRHDENHTSTSQADADGSLSSRPSSTDTNASWSAVVEREFLDMVSELVLASDERNHSTHVTNMAHISAEHFLLHGCVCQDRSPEERAAATGPCRTCDAYIEDKDVPQLLKALLHFVDFCFLFRPYPIFTIGCAMHTAELYRQAAYRSRVWETLTNVVASRTPEAVLAAATAAVEAHMPDDRNAPNKPWRPAMTRTSVMEVLRVQRAQSRRARGGEERDISSLTVTTADTEDDDLSDDLDVLLGPLRSYGRDICLVALETLYYPNLDAIGPYLPAAWVSSFYANHQRLVENNPSPAEYDAAIERVFRLGHHRRSLSVESAAAAATGLFYKAACYDVVEKCGLRVEPHWSLEADAAHAKQLFAEVLTPLTPIYFEAPRARQV